MTDVPQWWSWLIVACLAVLAVSVLVRVVLALLSRRARARSGTERRSPLRHVGAPWLIAASLVLAGGLALTMVAAPRLQGDYSSTTYVSLQPRDPIGTGADTLLLLGPAYLSRLESPQVLDEAAAEAGLSADELRDGADSLVEPSTTILQIEYTSLDATEASAGAQALATSFLDSLAGDDLVRGRPLGTAVAPEERSDPSIPFLLALGGLVSVIAAVIAGAAVHRRFTP